MNIKNRGLRTCVGVEISEQMIEVERHPTDAEDDHDNDQHPDGFSFNFVLCILLVHCGLTYHWTNPQFSVNKIGTDKKTKNYQKSFDNKSGLQLVRSQRAHFNKTCECVPVFDANIFLRQVLLSTASNEMISLNEIACYQPNAENTYTQCDIHLLPDNLSVSYPDNDHRYYVLTDESE